MLSCKIFLQAKHMQENRLIAHLINTITISSMIPIKILVQWCMDNRLAEINSVILFHPTQYPKMLKLYISFQFPQFSQQSNTPKAKIFR